MKHKKGLRVAGNMAKGVGKAGLYVATGVANAAIGAGNKLGSLASRKKKY